MEEEEFWKFLDKSQLLSEKLSYKMFIAPASSSGGAAGGLCPAMCLGAGRPAPRRMRPRGMDQGSPEADVQCAMSAGDLQSNPLDASNIIIRTSSKLQNWYFPCAQHGRKVQT